MWPLLEGSDYSRVASNQRSTEIEEIWYIVLSRNSIKLNAKMLPDANIWILRLQMNSTFTESIHAFTGIRLFAKQIMQ